MNSLKLTAILINLNKQNICLLSTNCKARVIKLVLALQLLIVISKLGDKNDSKKMYDLESRIR